MTKLRALTEEQRVDRGAVNGVLPNTDDIPEAPSENWAFARRLFGPIEEPVALRLGSDALELCRRKHEGKNRK
jgi:hypothetical protein